MRGPRRCASTLTSTSRPLSSSPATLMSTPCPNRRTRSSFRDEPGSASRRSTRIWSPGATRYCLPPLTMTADSNASGLGTASDCTKGPDGAVLSPPERGGCAVSSRRPLKYMSYRPAPQHHRLDKPESRQGGDRGRSAIRDQRQRDAGDGQQPDVHAHVLDHLDQDQDEHPAGEQLAQPVGRHGGRPEEPDQQGAEDRQQHEAAKQPELLGEDRKHEVRRPLGHEAELALQPVQPALAEKAAGPDRDPGLHQVVPGTKGILAGVEEDLEAPSLVAVEYVGQKRDGDTPGEREHEELPGAGAGEEQHAEQHPDQDDRRAEVGLGEDQAGGGGPHTGGAGAGPARKADTKPRS